MISVIIPTLNSEKNLVATLSSLVPAVVEGVIKDVVIADGGSKDDTQQLAFEAGVNFVSVKPGRGAQMAGGASEAKSEWYLFLHDDTILQQGWEREVAGFILDCVEAGDIQKAACFKFALDDRSMSALLLEKIVRLRCFILALPYGDQGILISKNLYKKIGGFGDMPLMEDVDLVRRIGRKRLNYFRSTATTSAKRYKKDGYVKRMLRNFVCLTLYFVRVPPRVIAKIYES